ncbi:hypothetical protein NECAME_07737 [Necator americanus]|uniref:Uncharacterized protein n=1 Tax=Necator americanus TaxID=51031 RepID=W2TM75_NECAM|nr:hypothetical protein NECAME_07737 [Necator americanus]ETN82843.1 hypothetical protein NECAME_07737 [Necator americanus]
MRERGGTADGQRRGRRDDSLERITRIDCRQHRHRKFNGVIRGGDVRHCISASRKTLGKDEPLPQDTNPNERNTTEC